MPRMVPVWLRIVVVAAMTAGLSAGPLDAQRILWGQCTAHCLQRHHSKTQAPQTNQTSSSRQHPDQVIRCRKSRECRWCLFACDRPGDLTDRAACQRDCQNPPEGRSVNEASCLESCEFLAGVLQNKTGVCPEAGSATQWDAACLEGCSQDAHCATYKKCCPNSCGHTCQKPDGLDAVLPPKPRHVEFYTRNDGGVKVTWGTEPSSVTSLPVVYILNWWCPHSRQPNFHLTERDSVRIRGFPRGIHPGEQCSYIVAAVSPLGSLGFTKVHHYVKKITKPSEPVNFRESGMQEARGRVQVRLSWQPPRVSDLEVWRYTVLWGLMPSIQPIYTAIHMNRKSISGSRLSYTLKNLQPGTEYFVQVLPVVKWNDKRMRGDPASMYLKTMPKPQPGGQSTQSPPYGHGADNTPIYDIQVQQAVFHQGALKANITWETDNRSKLEKFMIYWKPEHCRGPQHGRHALHAESQATSHEPWFRLYNLRYACQYAVRILPVNRRGRVLEAAVKRFQTPNCSDIRAIGPVRPDCPKEIPLPGRPAGLAVEVKPRGCGLAAVVMWEAATPSDVIDNYVLLLGESESVASTSTQVVYVSHPVRHDVPPGSRRLEVAGLRGDRHYSVQVRAASRAGDGPSLLQHFNTPSVVDCISPPPSSSPPDTEVVTTTTEGAHTTQTFPSTSSPATVFRETGRPSGSETPRRGDRPSPSSSPSPSSPSTAVSSAVRTSHAPRGPSAAPDGPDVTSAGVTSSGVWSTDVTSARTPRPSGRPSVRASSAGARDSGGSGGRGIGVDTGWWQLWLLGLCLMEVLRWTER